METLPPLGTVYGQFTTGVPAQGLIVTDCGPPTIVTVPTPGVPVVLPSITVSVSPITLMMPVRSRLVVFCAAVQVNEPDPVPLIPEEIVSQATFETADQT